MPHGKSIVHLTGLYSATLPHACTVQLHEKSCWKPQDYLQNRALFRMNERGRIPPIIYFSSTPESLWETESSLKCTPPVWIHTGRAHMLHHEEPDHFYPCSTHKDAFIPCSASILAQNGTYWHQVNSLPTTESQCCTSSACSRALGLCLTFMLDCMEPADPRGEVEVEVKAEAVTRGIVHDSQTLFFSKADARAVATQKHRAAAARGGLESDLGCEQGPEVRIVTGINLWVSIQTSDSTEGLPQPKLRKCLNHLSCEALRN